MLELDHAETIHSVVVWNASVLTDKSMQDKAIGELSLLRELIFGFHTMILEQPELQRAYHTYVPSFKS
jgi:hypothetical protein